MKLQAKILYFLSALPDTWAVKVKSSNQNGCPDVLVCREGKFYAIEVKDGSDTLKARQDEQLKRISRAGGRVCVARSLEDVITLFRTKGYVKYGKEEEGYIEAEKSGR